jgi:hypothetical protein
MKTARRITVRSLLVDLLVVAGLAIAGLIAIFGNHYIPGSPLLGYIAMPFLFSLLVRDRR